MEARATVAAYDASEESADGLALARLLAELLGDDLIIARVVPDRDRRPGVERASRTRNAARVAETRRSVLAAVPAAAGAQVVAVTDRSVAAGLRSVVEAEEDVDVLVFGSSNPATTGRRLMAGTPELVLEGTACPVAVAPPGFRERPEIRPAVIGVAYDGSDAARAALAWAADLADVAGLPVRLIGVAGDERDLSRTAAVVSEAAAGLPEELRPTWTAVTGSAATVLLEEAEDRVGLLVAGSRGRALMTRLVLGSVSAALIRDAACPVVIVPPGEPA